MLNVMNKDLFGFQYQIVDGMLGINVKVEPKRIDLKTYKSSPFCSFVINNFRKDMYEVNDDTMWDIILTLFDNNHFQQLNLYEDELYDEIAKKFDNLTFHTMMYYIDWDDRSKNDNDVSLDKHNDILIGAIPIKGIINPIPRSPYYKLYNGRLISCNPFSFNDEWYNRIVYVLVDIKSHFEFHEFMKTTDNPAYGYCINHSWYITGADETKAITYHPIGHSLPYKGRESLFEPQEKGKFSKTLFALSDVPKDIMTKADTLSVKI